MPCEPRRDGRALAAAGIVDDLRAEIGRDEPAGRVVGDDAHVSDRDGGLDDVAEHRERDLAAELGRQPALAAGAERDDDVSTPTSLRVQGVSGALRRRAVSRRRLRRRRPGPVVAHSCTSNQCVPSSAATTSGCGVRAR